MPSRSRAVAMARIGDARQAQFAADDRGVAQLAADVGDHGVGPAGLGTHHLRARRHRGRPSPYVGQVHLGEPGVVTARHVGHRRLGQAPVVDRAHLLHGEEPGVEWIVDHVATGHISTDPPMRVAGDVDRIPGAVGRCDLLDRRRILTPDHRVHQALARAVVTVLPDEMVDRDDLGREGPQITDQRELGSASVGLDQLPADACRACP